MLTFTGRRLVSSIAIVVDHGCRIRKPCSKGTARERNNVASRLRASAALEEFGMPEKETLRRARKAKRRGRAPSTQAGEFVREEIHHVREGKHGARSTKQAIAIGLSKARRAGVKLRAPKKGTASRKTRRSAERASRAGRSTPRKKASAKRSRAIKG